MNTESDPKAKLLISGDFGPEDIQVTMTGRRLTFTSEQLVEIDEAWVPKAAKGYFPGPLVRVEAYDLTEGGKISLRLGATDFKEFVGTRATAALRKYGYDNISNPIIACGIVVTEDGKMIISERTSGDAIGELDAPGGHIDIKKDARVDGTIDFFHAVIRETSEETGIHEDELSDPHCLGLTYGYRGLCSHGMVFTMKTKLDSEEILTRQGEEIQVIMVDPRHQFGHILADRNQLIESTGRLNMALALKFWEGKIFPKKVLRTKDQI